MLEYRKKLAAWKLFVRVEYIKKTPKTTILRYLNFTFNFFPIFYRFRYSLVEPKPVPQIGDARLVICSFRGRHVALKIKTCFDDILYFKYVYNH